MGHQNSSKKAIIWIIVIVALFILSARGTWNLMDNGNDNLDNQIESLTVPGDYQYFNNGDITVKSASIYSEYSEEEDQYLWYYKIEVSTRCRCAMSLYLHLFDDYKEHLNSQNIYTKFDTSGDFVITGKIKGYKTWWYPEVYYIAISEYKSFYENKLYH